MKYNNKIKHFSLLCLLPLALLGCTDWDDHYNDEQHVIAENTLWEEIESRDDLKPFKDLLEQYGYKDMLNGPQMYTVFAPVGAIDTVGIGASVEKIKTEVIENHIARFAYSANGAINNKPEVVMLNTKEIGFVQEGDTYKFGNQKFTTEYNIRAKNGVLHIIEGQQMFFHNIWEYLTTDARFDNIREYLYSFNDTILNEDKSVKGEINADGQQEYLDSVIYINNSLFYTIGQLDNEDSTYTMIIPTNEAWDEAYERIKPYYQFPSSISREKRDSMQNYYTQLGIVRDLVFSHTMQKSVEDSLISTTKSVFEKPFEYILSDYSDWNQSKACSNGGVFVVENLKHNPWDSWHKTIKIEAERANALDYDRNSSNYLYYTRTLPSTDTLFTKVSNGSYIEVTPKTKTSKPVVTFNVWNVLAGSYDVKVVLLPQTRTSSKGANNPNLFDGKVHTIPNNGVWKDDWIKDFPKCMGIGLVNNPMKMDTVNVGTVKMARCTYGTEMIGMKITLESFDKDDEGNGYSTTYLIDCVILEPSKK